MCFSTELKEMINKNALLFLKKMLKQECPYLLQDQGHLWMCSTTARSSFWLAVGVVPVEYTILFLRMYFSYETLSPSFEIYSKVLKIQANANHLEYVCFILLKTEEIVESWTRGNCSL